MTAFLSDSLAVACERINCLCADTVAELNAGSTTPQALDEEGELATIGTTLQTTVSTSHSARHARNDDRTAARHDLI